MCMPQGRWWLFFPSYRWPRITRAAASRWTGLALLRDVAFLVDGITYSRGRPWMGTVVGTRQSHGEVDECDRSGTSGAHLLPDVVASHGCSPRCRGAGPSWPSSNGAFHGLHPWCPARGSHELNLSRRARGMMAGRRCWAVWRGGMEGKVVPVSCRA